MTSPWLPSTGFPFKKRFQIHDLMEAQSEPLFPLGAPGSRFVKSPPVRWAQRGPTLLQPSDFISSSASNDNEKPPLLTEVTFFTRLPGDRVS